MSTVDSINLGLLRSELQDAAKQIELGVMSHADAAKWILSRSEVVEVAPDAWKDQDDGPLPEDPQIRAAFPTRSGRHDLYVEAMRLVGARYSKAGLVALVNWLLSRLDEATEVRDLERNDP